jgi:hypothetical protein
MEYLNPVLLVILVAEVCLGMCAWRSPRFLRLMAAHLLTRADVVDVSRAEGEKQMKVWRDKLGVNDDPMVESPRRVSMHRLSSDEVEVS